MENFLMIDRNAVLKDLKLNVIEFFFNPNTKLSPMRLTLRSDLVPEDFYSDKEQQMHCEEYHSKYPTYLGAWDVVKNKWSFIDVQAVQYVQVMDGY